MQLLTLAEIERRVRELARQIGSPDGLLPTFGDSEDFARPHIEVDRIGLLHYVVVERGQELERTTTADLDELLWHVFKDVTFSLACEFELRHRVSGQDFRRLMFAKQVELLAILSQEWADREDRNHAGILKRHPFCDELAEPAM